MSVLDAVSDLSNEWYSLQRLSFYLETREKKRPIWVDEDMLATEDYRNVVRLSVSRQHDNVTDTGFIATGIDGVFGFDASINGAPPVTIKTSTEFSEFKELYGSIRASGPRGGKLAIVDVDYTAVTSEWQDLNWEGAAVVKATPIRFGREATWATWTYDEINQSMEIHRVKKIENYRNVLSATMYTQVYNVNSVQDIVAGLFTNPDPKGSINGGAIIDLPRSTDFPPLRITSFECFPVGEKNLVLGINMILQSKTAWSKMTWNGA